MRSHITTQGDVAVTDYEPLRHDHLIAIPALADRLGVTERFVRRLVAERRVPFLKIGKFVRFDPREIERWVEDRRVPLVE